MKQSTREPLLGRKHAKSLQSCPTLCDPINCSLPGSWVHGDSPGKSTAVGCHALLQGIFPTQGWDPCLLRSCIVVRFFTAESLGNPRVVPFQPKQRHGFSPCPSLYPIVFPIPLACGTTCSKIFFLVNQKQTNLRSFPYDILLSE